LTRHADSPAQGRASCPAATAPIKPSKVQTAAIAIARPALYKLAPEPCRSPGMPDLIKTDLTLPNPTATQRLAAIVAAQARPGDAILLSGDLGAGKTHFARAFINALSDTAEEVPSPTFTLVQAYAATVAGQSVEISHFDLYRLKSPEETIELGIEEAFAEGISLVEWPDRLGFMTPRHHLALRLEIAADGNTRRASLEGTADWGDRLDRIARRFAQA
jgi:tRNA threonylcarbamoyladenosine biosynthesis protein TsaE